MCRDTARGRAFRRRRRRTEIFIRVEDEVSVSARRPGPRLGSIRQLPILDAHVSRLERRVSNVEARVTTVEAQTTFDDPGNAFEDVDADVFETAAQDAPRSTPASPPETLALARVRGPSRAHDAANDLLAFVRNLELESERRERREAADAKTKDFSVPKDGSVEANAAPAYSPRRSFPAAPRSSIAAPNPRSNREQRVSNVSRA